MTVLLIDADEPTAAALTELPIPPVMLPPSIVATVLMAPVLLEFRLETSMVLTTGDAMVPSAMVVLEADADEPTALAPMLLAMLLVMPVGAMSPPAIVASVETSPALDDRTSTPTPIPPPTALLRSPVFEMALPDSMVLLAMAADEPTALMEAELLMPPSIAPPVITPAFITEPALLDSTLPTVMLLVMLAVGLLMMEELVTDAEEPTALMPTELLMPPVILAAAPAEPMVPAVLTAPSLLEVMAALIPATPPMVFSTVILGIVGCGAPRSANAADETTKEAMAKARVCFFMIIMS